MRKPVIRKTGDGKDAVSICRQAGLKVTRQRVVIIGEILRARNHPDAETLYRKVKPRLPDLSLDTVYRTLRTLAEKGHILRLSTPLDRGHFDPDLRPHSHFVCRLCGRIWDLSDESSPSSALVEAVRPLGEIETIQMTGVGRCLHCHEKEKGESRPCPR